MTTDDALALLDRLPPAKRAEALALLAALPAELPSLLDFVPQINRQYMRPTHLQPLLDELERSQAEPVRVTACAPPRHAKTETVLAFAILTLLRDPSKTVAYVTYEAHTAQSKSRRARQYAIAAGLQLTPDANRLGEWRTPQGGGLIATGVGGPLTGQGVDVLLIDDPYKNRQQAESAAYRRMVCEWVDDVGETRVEPGGSVFIFHTRWHTDDLIAYVHKKGGWKHVGMPAIDAAGRALWPERWSLETLRAKEQAVGPYTWASLFQGSPRSREGQLFRDVRYYEKLPETYSAAIGIDLAYTAKTQSDHSVAVVLLESNCRWYVKEVVRKQVQAPAFSEVLKGISARYPGAGIRWYCSGTEQGSASFMQSEGLPLHAMPATADKYVRAQATAAKWNAGHILVPASAPPGMEDDLAEFVRVVTSFSGVGDAEDDDVDALAAAFDQLPAEEIREKPKRGTPEWFRAEADAMEAQATEQVERQAAEESGGGWGDGWR